MKKFLFFFVLLLSYSSCKKEDKTYDVLYKIIADGNNPSYTVRYTLADGSTKSQGTFTSATWVSAKMGEFEKGSPLLFTLESNGGNFHMYIYINGWVEAHRDAGGGGSQSLEAQIPN